MLKAIYKYKNQEIDLDRPNEALLQELLSSLSRPFNELEKLMDKEEFQEFQQIILLPFDEIPQVCLIM